jgi:hypothetical protein
MRLAHSTPTAQKNQFEFRFLKSTPCRIQKRDISIECNGLEQLSGAKCELHPARPDLKSVRPDGF